MRRSWFLVAALLLAACGASATPSPPAASSAPGTPSAVPTTAPSPSVTGGPAASPGPSGGASAAPSPQEVQLGSGATIATPGGGRATVGVVDFRKDARCGGQVPSDGMVYVTVSVGYAADVGSLAVSPTDWIVVDPEHRMAAANPRVTCQQGTYTKATLAQGTDTGGWLTFEFPADAAHLDLVYFPPGGAKARWHLW
jgi:hypothetical protein